MLRADSRIIEAGADRMRFAHLAVCGLQDVRPASVQHADGACVQRSCSALRSDAVSRRFYAPQLDVRIVDEAGKDAGRIAPASHAGDDVARQLAEPLQTLSA